MSIPQKNTIIYIQFNNMAFATKSVLETKIINTKYYVFVASGYYEHDYSQSESIRLPSIENNYFFEISVE